MKMIIPLSLFFAVPVYAHVPFVEGLDFQDDQASGVTGRQSGAA